MRSIGLIGKMGSGKSTAADALRSLGYIPLSFAAPLKEMVIDADPLVTYGEHFGVPIHLSDLLDAGYTFEECKREYPEVRRSLQRIGQGIRRIDPDYWVRNLLARAVECPPSVPIVVTDVRYPNEADALRKNGFTLVRVKRQLTTTKGLTNDETRAMLHESETALDRYAVDVTIRNDGSLIDLHAAVLDLV